MHIEADLDPLHAERLLRLQQQTNKPLSELISDLLAGAIDRTATETEGEKALRLLNEAGLIGCIEGDGTLSVGYKQHLWRETE